MFGILLLVVLAAPAPSLPAPTPSPVSAKSPVPTALRAVPVDASEEAELGGCVLRLTAPDSAPAGRGTLQWVVGRSNVVRQQSVSIRPGRSVVEMRGLPGWEGRLRQAVLAVPSTAGSVRCSIAPPTASEEWEIATQPRPIELTLINKATPRAVGGGWQIQHLAVGLACVSIGLALLWRPRGPVAVLIGGIVALGVVEVREAIDRWSLVAAGWPATVPGREGVWEFEQRATPKIARRPWTMQGIDPQRKYPLLYAFAEQPYVFDPQAAAVLVTSQPADDPLVQIEDLSLVRGPAHE